MIFQPPSSWPVAGEYDVIVCGAGPAGVAAACAAARLGCRTLLIERAGFAGGVATNCCCPYLMGFAAGGRQIVGGVADELVRDMDAHGDARLIAHPASIPDPAPIGDRPLLDNIIISLEGLRLAANRLLDRSGVTRLFYASLVGAVTDSDRLTAVAVDRAEGPALYRAAAFVDATGDADLVFRAGGQVRHYPVEQSMTKTILLRVGGVQGFHRPDVEVAFRAAVAAGEVPLKAQDAFMGLALLNPGEVLLNFTLTAGDGVDSADLTRMDDELRGQARLAVDWFRATIPGFADCFLVDTAHRVGVRAARGIIGQETITPEDLDAGTPVAEPIAVGTRGYGGHGLAAFAPPWRKSNPGLRGLPWRALLPVSFANVAAGGRAISADPRVLDAFRLMARCMATGQAAGVTAALMAQSGTTDYATVREHLLAQRAVLE
ncbi:MAG: FAD-dependent oxidoreductase [Armatimonadetes bacterium]|nr:FAD-dependent oxidoreductase [Armatimonadota bacterium]